MRFLLKILIIFMCTIFSTGCYNKTIDIDKEITTSINRYFSIIEKHCKYLEPKMVEENEFNIPYLDDRLDFSEDELKEIDNIENHINRFNLTDKEKSMFSNLSWVVSNIQEYKKEIDRLNNQVENRVKVDYFLASDLHEIEKDYNYLAQELNKEKLDEEYIKTISNTVFENYHQINSILSNDKITNQASHNENIKINEEYEESIDPRTYREPDPEFSIGDLNEFSYKNDVKKLYGEPQSIDNSDPYKDIWIYTKQNIPITEITFNNEDKIIMSVSFGENYKQKTSKGIGIRSTEKDIINAYGHYQNEYYDKDPQNKNVSIYYMENGKSYLFKLQNNKVIEISITMLYM